jgi:peptidylprolyl isomerase
MTRFANMTSATRMVRSACLTIACLLLPHPSDAQSPPAARPAQSAKPKAVDAASTALAATTAQTSMPSPALGAPTVAASRKAGDDVVARVGTTEVSADDIRSYVAALPPREQAALAKDPALFSQAVRLLLANQQVLQEALGKKWDQQPAVAAQLDRVRENAITELYLQAMTAPPASYPSDDELQQAYDANRNAMLVPRQFQLAQIFVAAAKDADKVTADKAKAKIDDIHRRLKAPGADFAAIATAENDAKNAADLGWVFENQIRPEIQAEVIGLARGAISETIKLEDGWHIIKLIDTKASYTRTLPEVRDQLAQQMRAERANAQRRAYLADVQKQHPPVVNELALSKLLGERNQAAK